MARPRVPAVLGDGVLSMMRTSWPLRRHSRADTKPPTPAPTIKIEIPVGGCSLTLPTDDAGLPRSRSICVRNDMTVEGGGIDYPEKFVKV